MRSTGYAPILIGIGLLATQGRSSGQSPHLTIDRVARYPNLAGTVPSMPLWSPDGSRVAFLWNAEGWPFRDVWVATVAGRTPRRATDMLRDEPGPRASTTVTGIDRRTEGGVSDLVWTADGELTFAYSGSLFTVHDDGTALTRLTSGAAGRGALAASPDRKALAFLQGGDLWLWPRGAAEPRRLTHVGVAAIGQIPGARYPAADVEFSSYKWSPTGRHLALQYNDRRHVRRVLIPNYLGEESTVTAVRRDFPGENDFIRRVAICRVEDGEVTFLPLEGSTDRRVTSYAWSPSGRQLLVDQSSEDASDRWIYLITIDDMSIRQLWHDRRETRVSSNWNAEWQSDGGGVLFISDFEGRHRLYALSLAGGAPRALTPADSSVIGESGASPLLVSPATSEVYFLGTQKSPYERQVYRVAQKGGGVEQVTVSAGTYVPSLAPTGRTLAVIRSDDLTPPELYVADAHARRGEERITHSPTAEFSSYEWAVPRYVTFRSRSDGVMLHGRLLEPPGLDRMKKHPVILGPVYSNTVRNRWVDREEWRGAYSTVQQFLAVEGGYIGLHVDVRGSVGYGRDFREQLNRDFGGIDVDDLHSGVDYLKTLPYVDADRIGLWGSSYGGLMTTMSLFKNPGVYKAGVAGAPATNVWHATTGEVKVAKRPDANPDVYRKISAISYGESLQDHLLILHGMQDDVVLFKDSVALTEKLLLLGKPVDFVTVPSSVHNWTLKDHYARYLLDKLVAHFDRYVGRGAR
jgi:dipeptidyl-peptidase 4